MSNYLPMRNVLFILLLNILSATVITAQPSCNTCDDALDCLTCDLEATYDGTSGTLIWCGYPNDCWGDGLWCSSSSPVQYPYIYPFVASSEFISVDIVDISCPPCNAFEGVQAGVMIGDCYENCVVNNIDCNTTDFNIQTTDLIIGELYFLVIDGCEWCECSFTLEIDHPDETSSLSGHIAAYDECMEECLTDDCGDTSSCGNINEISIWAGETIELFPLNQDCEIIPESDIDIVWEVNGVSKTYNYLFQKKGPTIETDPEKAEVIEICILEISTMCETLNDPICLTVNVNLYPEEIYEFSVCDEDFIDGWDPNIVGLDPNNDGYEWMGPTKFTIDGIEDFDDGCATYVYEGEECGYYIPQTICFEVLGDGEKSERDIYLYRCQFDESEYEWEWNNQSFDIIEDNQCLNVEGVSTYTDWKSETCDSSILMYVHVADIPGEIVNSGCEGDKATYDFYLDLEFLDEFHDEWPEIQPEYFIEFRDCDTGSLLHSTGHFSRSPLVIDTVLSVCVSVRYRFWNGIWGELLNNPNSEFVTCIQEFGPYVLNNAECLEREVRTCPDLNDLTIMVNGVSTTCNSACEINESDIITIRMHEELLPDNSSIDWFIDDEAGFVAGENGAPITSSTISSNWKKDELDPRLLALNYGNAQDRSEYVIISSGSGLEINDLYMDMNANCGTGCPLDCMDDTYGQGNCKWSVGDISLFEGCGNIQAVGPGDFIPPNSYLIVVLDDEGFGRRNLEALCSEEGCVYVLGNECDRCMDAFSDDINSTYSIYGSHYMSSLNYTPQENSSYVLDNGMQGTLMDRIPGVFAERIEIAAIVSDATFSVDCQEFASSSLYLKGILNSDLINDGCCNPYTQTFSFKIPLSTYYLDSDQDGYGDNDTPLFGCSPPQGYVTNNEDCDDSRNSVYPGALEVPNNDIDEDCDGIALIIDDDGDGYNSDEDCDDDNPIVNPGMDETCNDRDDNCDGNVDEGLTLITYYLDGDGDGYGDANLTVTDCRQPNGYVSDDSDCDDNDPDINPAETEIPNNGIDENCDGEALVIDIDGDGFNSSEDCDDTDPNINPGAQELCNDLDDNCNGNVDEGLTSTTYYIDNDGDGYGSTISSITSCLQPSGYVTNRDDCNDDDPFINPEATENCNEIDDNCDGNADEGLMVKIYYLDNDGDGYGNDIFIIEDCRTPMGYVENNTDCDDDNPDINPGADEVPGNGIDEDCDGQDQFVDNDGDGYRSDIDCDDSNPEINPGASEVCNDTDDNCDGDADEGLPTETYYEDNDGDGYGDESRSLEDCMLPMGYAVDFGDCDDNDSEINPAAVETPNNGIDEDCDGMDLVDSVHELSNSRINIFPNPVHEQINLDIEGDLNYRITLYNLNGKIVKKIENKSSIQVGSLPSGIYLLEVLDLNSRQKIVKRMMKGD